MALRDFYLTTGQAAAVLQVNRLTVQRWVKSGKLWGEPVGQVTLLRRDEVQNLAAERKAFR